MALLLYAGALVPWTRTRHLPTGSRWTIRRFLINSKGTVHLRRDKSAGHRMGDLSCLELLVVSQGVGFSHVKPWTSMTIALRKWNVWSSNNEPSPHGPLRVMCVFRQLFSHSCVPALRGENYWECWMQWMSAIVIGRCQNAAMTLRQINFASVWGVQIM